MTIIDAIDNLRTGNYNTSWYLKNAIGIKFLRLKSVRALLDLRKKMQKKSTRYLEKMAAYHDEGPRVAFEVYTLLDEFGIDVWLHAGSLLGVVRDGDFIPWDIDLDLCVIDDESHSWATVEAILTEYGFIKVREYTLNGRITEQTYATSSNRGFTFDVFAIRPTEHDRAEFFLYQREYGCRYKSVTDISVRRLDVPLPTGKILIDVRGWKLPIPLNAETLLEDHYGPNWQTPDPNFKNPGTLLTLPEAEGQITLHLK